MAENVSDEAFAALVLRMGLLPPERLESAREIQRQALEAGLPISLGEVLVQKHLLSAAQREQLEQQVRAQPQGGVRRLGNYQLVRKLGGGPKGIVYLAEDSMLGRQVALRVLPTALVADLGYVARFKQEGIAAAKVNHLHVATTFAVGHDSGYRYHVCEFCEGETLNKKLARQKLFSEDETLDLALQVAEGLEAAHAAGLVHRELRPANILVARDGTVKILDFGQAKPATTTLDLNNAYYATPEQARGETEFDARADLYSFGAILFHLLTGRPPFTGPSDVMVLTMHLAEPLPDPCEVRPGLSEGLAYILRRCLAKEPKDRYQDAAELREDLDRVRNGEEPAALARKRPQPTTRLRAASGDRQRSSRRGTDAQAAIALRHRHGQEETHRPRRPVAPAREGNASGRQRALEPGERANVQRPPASPAAPPPAAGREATASGRQRALGSGRRPATEAPASRPPSGAQPATRTPIPVPTPPRTPPRPVPSVAPTPEPAPQPAAARREATASARQRAVGSGRRPAAEPSEREPARAQRTPTPPTAAAPPPAPVSDSPPGGEVPIPKPPSVVLRAARAPTPAPAPSSVAQPAAEPTAPAAVPVTAAPEPTVTPQEASTPAAATPEPTQAPPVSAPASAPIEGAPASEVAATEAAVPASPAVSVAEAAGPATPVATTETTGSPLAPPATATVAVPTAPPVEAVPPRKKRRLLPVLLLLVLLSLGGGLFWAFSTGTLKPLLAPKDTMGAPFDPLAYWAVIGPFPAKDGADLDAAHPPDAARDFAGTFTGKAGPIRWKLAQMRSSSISFGRELGVHNQCNAYGVTWLDCPEETKAVLGIGSDDACRVFLNGQKVHENRAQRGCTVDSDKVSVVLNKGLNEILIKIAQGSGEWGFAATIRGADGKPITGLKGRLPAEIAPPPPEPPKKPAAPAPKPAAPQRPPARK